MRQFSDLLWSKSSCLRDSATLNKAVAIVGAVLALGAGDSSSARAELIFAHTAQNTLVSFDSGAPSAILSSVAISGLEGSGLTAEFLLGIDFRPANGLLYGLGSRSNLYTINTATGAATRVGASSFAPALRGSDFGFDFNPVPDRIRVAGSSLGGAQNGQNLRLNPDTGAVVDGDPATPGTQEDGALAFAAGDVNAGKQARIVGAAYTNSVAGATTTTNYAIDLGNSSGRDNQALLVRQGSLNGAPVSPNSGQLFTVGALGVDTNGFVGLSGFDISASTGVAYVSLRPFLGPNTFYTVDLNSGAATLAGNIGVTGQIRGLAVAPGGVIPESGTLALAGVGLLGLFGGALRRRRSA